MISRIGSQGYAQSANRTQRSDAQPVEARAQNTKTRETGTQSAAVVRIGSDARARASEAEGAQGAERSRLGQQSETRAKIEIEPVVAQPVPDFNAPKDATRSVPDQAQTGLDRAPAGDYQAPTNGYRVVA